MGGPVRFLEFRSKIFCIQACFSDFYSTVFANVIHLTVSGTVLDRLCGYSSGHNGACLFVGVDRNK